MYIPCFYCQWQSLPSKFSVNRKVDSKRPLGAIWIVFLPFFFILFGDSR